MSLLGHVAIGVATARRTTPAGEPRKKLGTRIVVFSALALLPDVDFVLHRLAPSIAYLDHRGATHSLAFALGVGASVALVIVASGRGRPVAWGVIAGAVVASHGVLDCLGDTSLGVALFWPFSDARVLAPWHVLPNPALQGLFSSHGLAELGIEFLLFVPFWLYAFLPRRDEMRDT
jgi:inner membrane protein